MCFRPATTTMGARICKSCYMVCDDVAAVNCPSCGAPLDPPASGDDAATAPAAPSTPSAPNTPSVPGNPNASSDIKE